jgi:predicted PurR-regulated permease PerM
MGRLMFGMLGSTSDPGLRVVNGVAAAVLAAIMIGAIYVGREVFVPIALAILLSFVLAPAARLLQRWHIPRAIAVVSVVLLAFASIFALGGFIATQMAELAGDLPRYELTMREKIRSVRGTAATSGTLERAADVLQELGKELDRPKDPRTPMQAPVPGQEAKPIPVEVRQPPPSALENIAALIAPLMHPLTTTGLVAIFVVFILLQREDLRNRLIKLAGSHDLQKTTAALDDAARRLSRLFLTQLALNSAFGLVIGTGLWLIGIPSPALWGILAAVLRFVPYIGALISAVFPLALAAAVDPGWTMLLWTAALFLVVEPIVGHVIEPMLSGHSAGLSPVAVVLSATFWTSLWGPIGLVLATPLTICLVVLGRHVERLAFLDVMFGDRPALSPSEIFYQRMLAGDPAEALDKAEEFLKERPLSSYYDDVALRGLKLAMADVARGSLDAAGAERIKAVTKELVEDLDDQDDGTQPSASTQDAEAAAAVEAVDGKAPNLPVLSKEELAPQWQADKPVLCIAGRGPLDEAAGAMLAQLLEKHGIGAGIESTKALSMSSAVPADGVAMVCLSYLDATSPAHMRYMIRRARRKWPDAKVLLGCWLAEGDATSLAATLKPDAVAFTLSDAVKSCLSAARGQGEPGRSERLSVVDASAA